MNKNIIDTERKRGKLTPRRSPYFQTICRGRSVGFRRNKHSGTWTARAGNKRYTLGQEHEFTYTEAISAAIKWIEGIENPTHTILDCVEAYAREVRVRSGTARAEKHTWDRLNSNISPSMMAMDVCAMTPELFGDWMTGMVKEGDAEEIRKSQATANRVMGMFKGALNLAYDNKWVDNRRGWEVSKFKDVEKARSLLLTADQVALFANAGEKQFGLLVWGYAITGARANELYNANVGDFCAQTGLLSISGKTGMRKLAITRSGASLFNESIAGRNSNEPLFINCDGDRWKPPMWVGIVEKARAIDGIPDNIVMGSLRHYRITQAIRGGLNPFEAAKYFGVRVDTLEKYFYKHRPVSVIDKLEAMERPAYQRVA